MPIRPNGFAEAPEPPKSKHISESPEGGSPRGWTFISTAYQCWRRWMYLYLLGFVPAGKIQDRIDPKRLGSAYHALLEGKGKEWVFKRYPNEVETALALYTDRIKNGPPLPVAENVEATIRIFNGRMTSKPDRIEKGPDGGLTMRDYKTAFAFSEHDEAAWNVDGGIIGELIAARAEVGWVDIQRKFERADGAKNTKIVRVEVTPEKRQALEAMVAEFWAQLTMRLEWTVKTEGADYFPQNLLGCVGKYGPCPYYNRCWAKGTAEALMYRDTKVIAPGVLEDKKLTKLAKKAAATIREAGIP